MSKETNTTITQTVTADILRNKCACAGAVELFAKTFPQGAEITRANILRAGEVGLDLDWFVNRFAVASAWAEYEKATASAWAEANKARASAWAKYNKAVASARAEYEKATASAWAEYDNAVASARAEFNKARASAACEAFGV